MVNLDQTAESALGILPCMDDVARPRRRTAPLTYGAARRTKVAAPSHPRATRKR